MENCFENKSYCFTGKLAELKRTQAEREVRSRNGHTQKVINKELNYLVIGSIPSTGWKHGDYGNKILKAKELISNGAEIKIISENDFMQSIEKVSPTEDGDINEKLLVIRYKALFQNGSLDIESLESLLKHFNEECNAHVNASIEEPFIYQDLYGEYENENLEDLLIFQCRIVLYLDLEITSQEIVDFFAENFELIKGLDGDLTWSEKKQGTANFAKLLQNIPLKTKLIQ